MSDQPIPPPNNTPNRSTGDASGFNWRLLILLSVACLILGLAFFNNPLGGTAAKSLSYSEFHAYWDQGRVLVDDTKHPLKVITTDTSYDAEINGFLSPELIKSPSTEEKITNFHVPVNLSLQKDEITAILGDKIRIEAKPATPDKPATVPPGEAAVDALATGDTLSLPEFRKALALGHIQVKDAANPLRILTFPDNSQSMIVGARKVFTNLVPKKSADDKDLAPVPFTVSVSVPILSDELKQLVKDKAIWERHKDYLGSAIVTFLPVLLILLLLFFLFRQQMKSAGRGAMSFGKSKARLLSQDRVKVTFKDVAGIQEAKEELCEIVEFLRDPRKFQKLGGSIPKGVLMVGAPGTGKTLLARAIAGEADVPFFSICLLYTSPSPRDRTRSRMPSSA